MAFVLGSILLSCTLFVDSSDLANGPAAATPDASNDAAAPLAPSIDGAADNSPIGEPEAGADAGTRKDAAEPNPSCKPNGTTCDKNEECCSDGCKSHECSN